MENKSISSNLRRYLISGANVALIGVGAEVGRNGQIQPRLWLWGSSKAVLGAPGHAPAFRKGSVIYPRCFHSNYGN